MQRSLIALCLMLFALAAGRCQAQAEGPDPLLCAIPPQTITAVLVDLRSDTESMKVVAGAVPAEQLAAIRASAIRGLRQVFIALGGDLDVEKGILSWLTGRVALCFIPVNGRRDPGLLLLLETKGGAPATASIQGLMQGGVVVKQLAVGAPVEDIPVWKAMKLARGASLTYMEPVLMIAWPEICLAQALKHMKAINAGAAVAPVTQSLAKAPPGFIRFALAPYAFAMAKKAGAQLLAVTAVAGAVRFDKTGLMSEVLMTTQPDAGPWQALASLKPTYSESVTGIPDTAVAVLTAARPAVWLHGLGIPILDGLAAGDIGPRPIRAIGNSLAVLFSDLLGQEAALGIVPTDAKPSWLTVFTSARATALPGMIEALIQSGQGVQGIRFTPAPLGDAPGWVVQLNAPRRRMAGEAHLAVVKGRLLAAGSRKALEAGAAALSGGAGSVAKAAWYTEGMDALGPKPLARSAVNTRALAPLLASLIPEQGPVPAKMVAPFIEALLAGVGRMGGGLRLDGNTLRVIGFAGLDYPKMATVAAIAVPAATGGVAAALAAQGAKPGGGAPAALAPEAAGDPQASACVARLRQLAQAARLYAKDWAKLPRADGWAEDLEPYLKGKAALRCPADGGRQAVCYAFNRALAELPLEQIEDPGKVVLFYECASADASPAGAGQGLPKPARHGGKHAFAFLDGHVELAAEPEPTWRWKPGQ